MTGLAAKDWDIYLSRSPDAHLLQTGAWGELKAAFGWQVTRLAAGEAGAQILFRRLPLGLTFAYVPRGPVGGEEGAPPESRWGGLWPKIDATCRQRRAVFLKVEPDLWEAAEPVKPPPGFQPSPHSIQPLRTLVVSLLGTEDQILSRMKQKTRYNIRLAVRRGVIVRPCADLELFYHLMETTGRRDGFGVHSLEYYRRAYELFQPGGGCEMLLAEAEGQPLAALMVFAQGTRAWYFYGASANTHREYMPTYLLQWEAMRWARAQGCTEYDLWGVPDEEEEVLEAEFTRRSEGLWGVYRFKRGFGGVMRRAVCPWDRVYQPVLYRLYRLWLRRSDV